MYRENPMKHITANSKPYCSFGKSLHTYQEIIGCFSPLTNSTNPSDVFLMVWDLQWHACMVLSNIEASYKVVIQDIHSDIPMLVVTIIISKHRQLPVINPVTTKIEEGNQPSMLTRVWTVLSNYSSIREWCIEIKPHIHGPLQLIQNIKDSCSSITIPENAHAAHPIPYHLAG